MRTYKTVSYTKYVKLENFTFDNNVKIYGNNKLLEYNILSNENKIVKIELEKNSRTDTLIFFIENAKNYKISLYTDKNFLDYIISKEVAAEELLIPDSTWITEKTQYLTSYDEMLYENTDLTKKLKEYYICRYREKYVYKYKIAKEYYDDNYYSNLDVDGYIKDTSDYKVFYKGEPITNTIEITKEKIVKEPQIEYIYVPSENEIQTTDSSKIPTDTKETNCLPEIKTQIMEKEIFKIPKKIYIILVLLLLIIIFQTIKLYKKYVD